jgi:hypothetical protein
MFIIFLVGGGSSFRPRMVVDRLASTTSIAIVRSASPACSTHRLRRERLLETMPPLGRGDGSSRQLSICQV